MMKLEDLEAERHIDATSPLPLPEQEICDRYEEVFTAAVNDALRERKLLRQTLPNGIMPLRDNMKAAGFAFTLKGAKNLTLNNEMASRAEMLDAITENSFVVWDTSLDLESAPSGLWNAVETRVFVDWGATPDSKRGLENACLNAFRISALECASNLAEARGLDPSSWRERASSLRAAFQDRLWWEDRDRFAAARSPEGDGFLDTPSLHANVLALAWDLGTPEQMRRIESWVLDALARNCAEACTHDQGSGHLELYFQHYAYLALYRRGHFRQAEALIQAHWGTMMRSGAWTAWEAMSRGWRGTGSLCHAWSCAPVWVMSAEILGLSPATPGNLDHLRVSPTGETIDWAAGEFPHPRGTVSVRWRVDGAFLRVSLGLPPGVTCEVVPRGRLADLRLCLAPSL